MNGITVFFQRQLIARDPEFIRNILIKDFQYFVDRVIPVDEKMLCCRVTCSH